MSAKSDQFNRRAWRRRENYSGWVLIIYAGRSQRRTFFRNMILEQARKEANTENLAKVTLTAMKMNAVTEEEQE